MMNDEYDGGATKQFGKKKKNKTKTTTNFQTYYSVWNIE